MDEWLATGDEGFQHKANARLHELVNKTKILIIASHSKQLLVNNCNRFVWLEYGKIRMDGDAETVANAYFWAPMIIGFISSQARVSPDE